MSALDLDLLQSWEGREETNEDVITLPQVQMLASTLDHDPKNYLDGAILPPLYHWLYFLQPTKISDLASDGHAKKGAFMPPVPFPSRMFAGARIEYLDDLRIGEQVQRTSTIQAVRYTEGRSGPLIFVTVAHKISNKSSVALVEEQDIAYRPKPPSEKTLQTPKPRCQTLIFAEKFVQMKAYYSSFPH
jgi:3-methylfumaryl-CoA hydratase